MLIIFKKGKNRKLSHLDLFFTFLLVNNEMMITFAIPFNPI